MTHWKQRFEIVEKWSAIHGGTYYLILEKDNSTWSFNMTTYPRKSEAASAASNIFRAEQRKIEKALLGG